MANNNPTVIPFENIGLCFSGGGYRATFYALGVVSYLEQVSYKDKTLLSAVKALSTVSGGTLLGVGYAKAVQQEDYTFATFFKKFYDTFKPENDKLLETAVAKLEDDQVWMDHPYKKRSLINAFALTYEDMAVFEGNFELFESSRIKQLKEVCFNATDFSFGLTYRFQNEGYFGNDPLYGDFSSEVDKMRGKVKLADAIASSSCFPVGFEPLVFPDDYFKDHNSTDYKNLKGLGRFIEGVGIMDGGIADNQGIGSMVLISKRMKTDNPLNLIMVNDVGSYFMEPWKQDTSQIGKGSSLKRFLDNLLQYLSLKPIYWITLLVGLFLLLLNSFLNRNGNGWSALDLIGGVLAGAGILMTGFGLVASIVKLFAVARIKALMKKAIPPSLLDDIFSFQKLDTGLIKRMLTERATSALKMINDVFLKQMRRLNYHLFYNNDDLKHKRITTLVYELNGQATPYAQEPKYNEHVDPQPTEVLKSVSLIASKMDTTLWWSKDDINQNRMDSLIACGQFTVCYELMVYILNLQEEFDDFKKDKDLNELYKALEDHWKTFNKNPLWLVNKLK